MTYSELLAARDNPREEYAQLGLVHDRIVNLHGEQLIQEELGRLIEETNVVEFEQIGTDIVYSIRADRVENGVFTSDEGGQVVVIETSKGKPTRRFEPKRAKLVSQAAGPMTEKQFNLEMYDLEVEILSPGMEDRLDRNTRESVVLNAITVPPDIIPDLSDFGSLSIDELVGLVRSKGTSSKEMNDQVALIIRKKAGLLNQVTSRINSRFALSLTTLLLLLLGSILAVLLKRSRPLTVYMWAFLPALLDLVLISSGSSMIRAGTTWMGLLTLWSGNLLLLLLIALAYRRLARH